MSKRVLEITSEAKNDVFLSYASVWELQIKVQLNKLSVPLPPREFIQELQDFNRIELLAIQLDDIYSLSQLPLHHRDPFDRLIIAQAYRMKLPLITSDHIMWQYPIETVW